MKKFFKATFITAACVILVSAAELRAKKDPGLGLTVGLDYVSNYMTRGEFGFNYYDSGPIGGFFFPFVSFDVFDTGLRLEVRGEVSETWIGGSGEEDNESANYAQHLHSIDFNVNYTYSIDNIITFDAGVWYYRYKTWTLDDGPHDNFSYFDFYLSAAIDTLPLTPTFSITYSHFTDKRMYRGDFVYYNPLTGQTTPGDGKNGDWYFQLGIEHSFELANATFLDLNAVAGYYYKRAIVPKSPDISDIDLSAGISTTKGIVAFTGSFHYVIVPGTQFKSYTLEGTDDPITMTRVYPLVKDIHRFYARFGASVSL